MQIYTFYFLLTVVARTHIAEAGVNVALVVENEIHHV